MQNIVDLLLLLLHFFVQSKSITERKLMGVNEKHIMSFE